MTPVEGFQNGGNLRDHGGHVIGNPIDAGSLAATVSAGGNHRDAVDLGQRLGEDADDLGQTCDELIENGGLVVVLIGVGLDTHSVGFGFALSENDLGLGIALQAGCLGKTFGDDDFALAVGFGQRFDLLALGLGRFDDGGFQLLFAAFDLGFLHRGFGLDAHLLDLDLLGDHFLLLYVGFDLVRLVGGGLLHLDRLEIIGPFHFEVALGFGLAGLAGGFGDDLLLIGFGLGDAGIAQRLSATDDGVTLGFRGGNIGGALDEGDIGTTHIENVFVAIAHFLDGEGDDLEAHLVHVIGDIGAHAVGHHLRFLDDVLDRELTNDAAQMSFHDEANQRFALLRRFVQELLGRGQDADRIGLDLDLGDGLDIDGYSLEE